MGLKQIVTIIRIKDATNSLLITLFCMLHKHLCVCVCCVLAEAGHPILPMLGGVGDALWSFSHLFSSPRGNVCWTGFHAFHLFGSSINYVAITHLTSTRLAGYRLHGNPSGCSDAGGEGRGGSHPCWVVWLQFDSKLVTFLSPNRTEHWWLLYFATHAVPQKQLILGSYVGCSKWASKRHEIRVFLKFLKGGPPGSGTLSSQLPSDAWTV